MFEISKPEKPVYWVARDENGNILHTGVTEPGQVTTSGQSVMVQGTKLDQVQDLAQFLGNPPAFNYEPNTELRSWVFPDEDHLYIPVAPHIAEQLSRALYALVNPGEEGLYAGVIQHPSGQGYALLQCRKTDIIPLSLAVDATPLRDVLQITVDDGALTSQELDFIVNAVQQNAGETVNLEDFVPLSWQPYIMDYDQAVQAGYLIDDLGT